MSRDDSKDDSDDLLAELGLDSEIPENTYQPYAKISWVKDEKHADIIVGHLPKAPQGRFLTLEEINKLAGLK